jgi:hypothetical protein
LARVFLPIACNTAVPADLGTNSDLPKLLISTLPATVMHQLSLFRLSTVKLLKQLGLAVVRDAKATSIKEFKIQYT